MTFFWIFRGALWERLPRVDTHSTLAHPTKMAEAWRRERAIVKLHNYPDDGNECSAIIVRDENREGVYLVRVKGQEAGMPSIEIAVLKEHLGPLAPPEGLIDPVEEPLYLPQDFPVIPSCGFSRGANEDPGLARAIQTTVELVSPAEMRRLTNCTRITAVEKAVKVKIEDTTFKQGCMRAGKEAMEACGSTNPIVRFAKYIEGYADAVGRGVTHEDFKMWLAKLAYWEDTITVAKAAATARDNRTPMVFVTVSKCAADKYCAQMRRDENDRVRKHRVTLDDIRDKLAEMYPANLIILLDVPATLFGCARIKPIRGYSGCRAVTAAGKVILQHMLMVILPTAAACGFAVGGIATICADITEDWLTAMKNGPTSVKPPPMLYDTVANYPRMRVEWFAARDRVVVGRGLHYVFMHLQDYPDVARICIRLTAIALGIDRMDEAIGIGSEDHATMVKLATMFHTLAGGRGRNIWKAAQVNEALHLLDPDEHPPARNWEEVYQVDLAALDYGDFDDMAAAGDESDSESYESDE